MVEFDIARDCEFSYWVILRSICKKLTVTYEELRSNTSNFEQQNTDRRTAFSNESNVGLFVANHLFKEQNT